MGVDEKAMMSKCPSVPGHCNARSRIILNLLPVITVLKPNTLY